MFHEIHIKYMQKLYLIRVITRTIYHFLSFFGQVLNAISIKAFGTGDQEVLQALIQVIFLGEGLASHRVAKG